MRQTADIGKYLAVICRKPDLAFNVLTPSRWVTLFTDRYASGFGFGGTIFFLYSKNLGYLFPRVLNIFVRYRICICLADVAVAVRTRQLLQRDGPDHVKTAEAARLPAINRRDVAVAVLLALPLRGPVRRVEQLIHRHVGARREARLLLAAVPLFFVHFGSGVGPGEVP